MQSLKKKRPSKRKLTSLRPALETLENRVLMSATEFRIPTPDAQPVGITRGADGNLWFAELHAIGRITPAGAVTEFRQGLSPAAQPFEITAGPDGNVWFTEGNERLGRITPAGVITEFIIPQAVGGGISGITAGPDGNIWFTEPIGGIGRFNPAAGVATVFDTTAGGTRASSPGMITRGPDGNLWYSDSAGKIGRITPAGVITEFSTGMTPGSDPAGITTGPDGNLWFVEDNSNRIGRITPAGVITEFSNGVTPDSSPARIVTGPDGNLWFTEQLTDRVARITPAGVVTEFASGITTGAGPAGIVLGPDANLWFTELNTNQIGRLNPAQATIETTTTLRSSAATVVLGQSVLLTANVTAVQGGVPTGIVSFMDGNTVLRNVVLDANGQATFSASLGAGNHTLTGFYFGNFPGAVSAPVTVNVNAPGITATRSPNGVLSITGDAQDNTIVVSRNAAGTILVNNGAVLIQGGPATVANTNSIVISSGLGNDNLSMDETNGPLPKATMSGDDGDDTVSAGSGNDSLSGGSGNDTLSGAKGDDTLVGNAGNDTFQWNPGDGNDFIDGVLNDGGSGADRVVVNGSNLAEKFVVSAEGNAGKITRDIDNVTLDLADIENVDVNPLGGADTITVNDLTGTGVTQMNVGLAGSTNGTAGDGQADTVIVNGTGGNDAIPILNPNPGVVDVQGGAGIGALPYAVLITNTEGASDSLVLNGLGGNDTIDGSNLLGTNGSPVIKLSLNGGDGNDTLTGSPGNTTVDGGTGTDTINSLQGTVTVLPSTGDDTVNVNVDRNGVANVVFDQTQRIGQLNISDGGVATLSSSSASAKALTITGLGITGTGKLDLTGNALILDYAANTPSLISAVRLLVAGAYHNGAWDHPGITSSLANASTFALGFAEARDVAPNGTFLNQPTDNSAVVIRFTLYGDTDLDGRVNFNDLVHLAQNYNTTVAANTHGTWFSGDFTYDDQVTFNDLVKLAQNNNTTLPAPTAAPLLTEPLARTTTPTHPQRPSKPPRAVPAPAPIEASARRPRPKRRSSDQGSRSR
jgi:streptogramin lyase